MFDHSTQAAPFSLAKCVAQEELDLEIGDRTFHIESVLARADDGACSWAVFDVEDLEGEHGNANFALKVRPSRACSSSSC